MLSCARTHRLYSSYSGLHELLEVGLEEVHEADLDGALEREAAHEEDCEHHVREERREVDHFAERLHAADERAADEDPRDNEREQQKPVDAADVVDALRLHEHHAPNINT